MSGSLSKAVGDELRALNIRAAEIIAKLEIGSIGKISMSYVQYALAHGWFLPEAVTGEKLTTPRELYYGIVDDLFRACRNEPSHYLDAKAVPKFHRELFEALIPASASSFGTVPTNYRWRGVPDENHDTWAGYPDPATINEIGEWNDISLQGFYLIGPQTLPSLADTKEAVNHFFQSCLAIGHKPWNGNPTVYLKSAEVFAFEEKTSKSIQDTTFSNARTTMAFEYPITHNWLASLRLVDTDDDLIMSDRKANKTETVTASIGAAIGHRLLQCQTGHAGAKDNLIFKLINFHMFEIGFISILNGAQIKREQSTKTDVDIPGYFLNGDFSAFRALLWYMVCSQIMKTSPATWDLQSRVGRSFHWGTRFMKPTARALEHLYGPLIIQETLRMIHSVILEVFDDDGKKTDASCCYYPVLYLPAEEKQLDLSNYYVGEWNDNNYGERDVIEDVANYVNSAGSDFKDYVDDFMQWMHYAKEHFPILSAAVHQESQAGAQLMLMDNAIPVVFVPSEDGVVCVDVGVALDTGKLANASPGTLKHLRKLIDLRDKAVAAPSIFEKYKPETKKNAKKSTSKKMVRAVDITLGVNLNVPGNGAYDLFKQLMLPEILVPINGTGNNMANVISQFKIRDSTRPDSSSTIPALELMNNLYRNTVTRGAAGGAVTELTTVLKKKMLKGRGAGVAAGGPNLNQPWMPPSSLADHYLPPVAAGVVDGLGMRVPLIGMANDIGGWVVSLMDPEKMAMRQERRAERQTKRKEKRKTKKGKRAARKQNNKQPPKRKAKKNTS